VKYYYTIAYRKKLEKTIRTNPKLAKAIHTTLSDFFEKQNYPSLRLHKLSGNSVSAWSISVNKSIRIIFYYVKDGVVLVNFGKHEEVY
jgi:mRNA-degrading endonuclease YafQ of YafQ-DinJ toxin-antitoxin module